MTLDRIEALAPDQASLAAARKLLKPTSWATLGVEAPLVWGECQGSGATPYRVVLQESDAGYKCTCPSRKFPCKHTLALMWLRAEGKVAFVPAPVPEWVRDWLGRRRGPVAVTAGREDAEPGPRPSIAAAAAAAEEEAAADPRAELRAAAARERNRADREASVLAGLDELDVWLADQAERGMAAFVPVCGKSCRAIAQRLVDAKAPGLASRVDGLPARLVALPEAARPAAAIAELGQLHLVAAAYRGQDELRPALRADARAAVGWVTTREALLLEEDALRVLAGWRVVAVVSEVQPDRLRRVETWLWREGEAAGGPHFAALVDFVPVGTGTAAGGYLAGDRIRAELVFYPGAVPLRAQIVRVEGGAERDESPLAIAGTSLAEAFAGYARSLSELPWLGTLPLAFRGARVRRSGQTLYVCDGEGGLALPLLAAQEPLARPLLSAGAIDGVLLWSGYHATLCWAETELGRWVSA